MADETTNESNNTGITVSGPGQGGAGGAGGVAESTPEALGDAGKEAIRKEREARKAETARAKDLETQLTEMSGRLEAFESANASETEKAIKRAEKSEAATATAIARAEAAETALLRFEVAQEKGLTGKALDLLAGSTREELEAKADSILELIDSKSSGGPVVKNEGRSPEGVSDDEVIARSILLG